MSGSTASAYPTGPAPVSDIHAEILRSTLAEVRGHRNDAALRDNETKHRHLNAVRLNDLQYQGLILPIPSAAAGGSICPLHTDGSPFPLLKTLHHIYHLKRRDLNIWLEHYGLSQLNDEKEDRRTLFLFFTVAPGLEARMGRFCPPEERSEGFRGA